MQSNKQGIPRLLRMLSCLIKEINALLDTDPSKKNVLDVTAVNKNTNFLPNEASWVEDCTTWPEEKVPSEPILENRGVYWNDSHKHERL